MFLAFAEGRCRSPPPDLHARLLERNRSSRPERQYACTLLRRETFLKARVQRLLQRRDHLDEVRACRRGADVTGPEKLQALTDSSLAAQAARQRIQLGIAEKGSKEVRKARCIAQRQKEIRRREAAVKLQAIQQKLRRAEERRNEAIARRSLGPRRSTAASKLDAVSAARRIQSWWLSSRGRLRARKFRQLHLEPDLLSVSSFGDVANAISSRTVIECTIMLLVHADLIPAAETSQRAKEAVARIFLTTILIICKPDDVFSSNGPEERQLLKKAEEVFFLLNLWLTDTIEHGRSNVEELRSAFLAFSSAFDTWRAADSSKLLKMMLAQFVELDLIWQAVKRDADATVTQAYYSGIKHNKILLLARIRRLSGSQASGLVKKALTEARLRRLPQSKSFSLSKSPVQLSNRRLIHELALDPAYQLQPPERNGEEKEARNAFFDLLICELQMGHWTQLVPAVVLECKMCLLRLVMPDSATFKSISTTFDLVDIELQCRSCSFDLDAFTALIITMMKSLCAPHRDSAVRKLDDISATNRYEAFSLRVQSILDVLETLMLDSVNFHIRLAAPKLIPEAIAYERGAFAADLAKDKASLLKTRKWLSHGELTGTSGIHRLAQAYMMLLKDASLPELLHLDRERVVQYAHRTQHIITAASALTITRAIISSESPRMTKAVWNSLKDRLLVLLAAGSTIDDLVVEINSHMDRHATEIPEITRKTKFALLRNMLTRKESGNSAVMRLLSDRCHATMADAVSRTISGERNGTAVDVPDGLQDVQTEWHSLTSATTDLFALNYRTYAPWYDALLAELP
ncbi:hypothetical protein PYCC9005_001419 [Savitreella phatthalungensis]